MNPLKVLILCGGVSSEHTVSCVSAQNFFCRMSAAPEKYDVQVVYIARDGRWYLYEGRPEALHDAPNRTFRQPVAVLTGMGRNAFHLVTNAGLKPMEIDVVIPVLHGLNGEDGTVQGLLELARIPYVGCGVLASALAMDKVFTKPVVDALGIRQADYLALTRYDIEKNLAAVVSRVEEKFGYPMFIKPSRAGSSVGVTKAHHRAELEQGLKDAAKEDRRVLVEEFIDGREVECAVLGSNHQAVAYSVGEILAAAEFYDFEAKYQNAASRTVVPAELSEATTQEIRDKAVRIFQGIDGEGLSRVDFFVDRKTGEVIFNEINTFPGFTPISMWPMLVADGGIDAPAQIDALIALAMERKPSYGS